MCDRCSGIGSWIGHARAGRGAVQATAGAIAQGKVSLPFMEAFLRGILCNILVCLAVWLSYTAHNVAGKVPGDHPAGGVFIALYFG
tara:strand:- start:1225 stop:1482 length:258 start_codon:yes stop_codon:yes gene_type:complete